MSAAASAEQLALRGLLLLVVDVQNRQGLANTDSPEEAMGALAQIRDALSARNVTARGGAVEVED